MKYVINDPKKVYGDTFRHMSDAINGHTSNLKQVLSDMMSYEEIRVVSDDVGDMEGTCTVFIKTNSERYHHKDKEFSFKSLLDYDIVIEPYGKSVKLSYAGYGENSYEFRVAFLENLFDYSYVKEGVMDSYQYNINYGTGSDEIDPTIDSFDRLISLPCVAFNCISNFDEWYWGLLRQIRSCILHENFESRSNDGKIDSIIDRMSIYFNELSKLECDPNKIAAAYGKLLVKKTHSE